MTRKRIAKEKERSYPCGLCNDNVMQGIKCDVCQAWLHQTCSELSESAFITYSTNNGLIWVCLRCRKLAENSLKSERKQRGKGPVSKPEKALKAQSDTQPIIDDAYQQTHNEVQTRDHRASIAVTHQDIPANVQPKATNRKAGTGQRNDAQTNKWSTVCASGGKQSGQSVKGTSDTQINYIVSKLGNYSSAIESLQRAVGLLQQRYDTELGRNRNVLVHGYPENPSLIPHVRRKAHEALVATLLRHSGMSTQVRWRRTHRVGRWRANATKPRPLLIEFCSQRDRDVFLSKLPLVYAGLDIELHITPDVPITEAARGGPHKTTANGMHQCDKWSIMKPVTVTESRFHILNIQNNAVAGENRKRPPLVTNGVAQLDDQLKTTGNKVPKRKTNQQRAIPNENSLGTPSTPPTNVEDPGKIVAPSQETVRSEGLGTLVSRTFQLKEADRGNSRIPVRITRACIDVTNASPSSDVDATTNNATPSTHDGEAYQSTHEERPNTRAFIRKNALVPREFHPRE